MHLYNCCSDDAITNLLRFLGRAGASQGHGEGAPSRADRSPDQGRRTHPREEAGVDTGARGQPHAGQEARGQGGGHGLAGQLFIHSDSFIHLLPKTAHTTIGGTAIKLKLLKSEKNIKIRYSVIVWSVCCLT